ncbi:hypothetical protein QF027_008176 [Streptomyces canus]|nr:hypothetical protein [Streptomyces canus]
MGGAGLPVNPLRRPVFGGDLPALVLQVQIFHVQAQHLVGPRDGLVEHLPERLLPQSDVQAPQGGDLCCLVRYAFGEVVDRGDVDHGFETGGEGLVVAGETAVHRDPTNTSLYYPVSLYDVKCALILVSADYFDVDSEAGAAFDDDNFEAGVDPTLGDGWVLLLRLVEEAYSQGVFREAGGGDGHGEDEADGVGEDAAFPADDLLGGVGSLAGQGYVGGGLHALGVDHGGGRFGLAAVLDAGQAGQVVVELGEDSLVAPTADTFRPG